MYNKNIIFSYITLVTKPCLTPLALGTDASFSLHRRTILLPSQKPSQLLVLETCWALMSFILQLPSKLVPKISKAWNATAVNLLMD